MLAHESVRKVYYSTVCQRRCRHGTVDMQACSVLPGDYLTPLLEQYGDISIGPGLQQQSGKVTATCAGVLSRCKPNRFFVLTNNRRYIPSVGDVVVGVVTDRMGEAYNVALHGSCSAQLPLLAFDGATKRHKPELAAGSLVFCRVSSTSRGLDPELSCMAGGTGPRKDWATGQCVYGELKGGQIDQVSVGLARRMMDPACPALTALGSQFPFELAVGLNGVVWYQAATQDAMAAIAQTLAREDRGSSSVQLSSEQTRSAGQR